MASLFDEFAKGVGAAVSDIREKVVEEAYFGRVVSDSTPAPEAEQQGPGVGGSRSVSWPANDTPGASVWEAQLRQVQPTKAQEPQAPDHDIDR